MIIKDSNQFNNLIKSQKAPVICTIEELRGKVEELQKENIDYTIFSINDENDNCTLYVTYGITRVNNIGYYILKGNHTLPQNIIF